MDYQWTFSLAMMQTRPLTVAPVHHRRRPLRLHLHRHRRHNHHHFHHYYHHHHHQSIKAVDHMLTRLNHL